MAGMVGSLATRSSHPKFLRLVSRLVTVAAGQPVTFRLPFFDHTKADLVRGLAREGLDHIARSTVSCVHFPLRERPHKQCGVCAACVCRRQAMFMAGIDEPVGTYKYDMFYSGPLPYPWPEDASRLRNAVFAQLHRLAELDRTGEFHRTDRDHLIATEVIEPGGSFEALFQLFRRYVREWREFLATGQERGWLWADGFAPRRAAG
jgi:hypothetical protein